MASKTPGIRFWSLFRVLLVFVPVGLVTYWCSNARMTFALQDPVPIYQVFLAPEIEGGEVDQLLRNAADRTGSADKGEDSAGKRIGYPGLLTPVSDDGYCVTARHVLGTKDAFVLVEEKSKRPLFLVGREGDQPLLKPVLPDAGEKNDRFSAALLPVEVVTVWEAEGLALVKVPFPTPEFFSVAETPARFWEPILRIGNPSAHKRSLTSKARRVAFNGSFPKPSDFFLLYSRHRRFLKLGDSGGPVIDREGGLIGINWGGSAEWKGRAYDVAIGLRSGPIRKAIEESRKQRAE